jgi:ubiquinone/menaquinone biosynthesis C-methylase UbiE
VALVARTPDQHHRPFVSFDRLAPHYRWMESVLAGGLLQRCRLAWLDEVSDARRVLIVGEGNGRFLSACAQRMPGANFTVVDSSREMLAQAEARWQRAGGRRENLSIIHAALPQWTPPAGAFDLVATHFFLDCFPESTLPAVVAKLADAAQAGARWLLSDFEVPETGPARVRAQLVLAVAYAFFRVATRLPATRLVPPDNALRNAGFIRERRRTFNAGLLKSELWRQAPT